MELAKLENTLLTLREAAVYLGVSQRTVWAITAPRGDLPVIRIGRSRRYSQVDLADFADRHRVRSECGKGGGEI